MLVVLKKLENRVAKSIMIDNYSKNYTIAVERLVTASLTDSHVWRRLAQLTNYQLSGKRYFKIHKRYIIMVTMRLPFLQQNRYSAEKPLYSGAIACGPI